MHFPIALAGALDGHRPSMSRALGSGCFLAHRPTGGGRTQDSLVGPLTQRLLGGIGVAILTLPSQSFPVMTCGIPAYGQEKGISRLC